MRSGITVVSFVPRDDLSKRTLPSLPRALAQQRVEQSCCFRGLKKVLVIEDFRSGNWNLAHEVWKARCYRGLAKTKRYALREKVNKIFA